MKVVYHKDFNQVYTSDPAAAPGRIKAILDAIKDKVTLIEAIPAKKEDIEAVHTQFHIENVTRSGLYDIVALAVGGAIQAAKIGLDEPCFGLIRPPGHHASADSSWGFCYFNNMAVALTILRQEKMINRAFVLDIDLHFGDGTVNILENSGYVAICNPKAHNRKGYIEEVSQKLPEEGVDLFGISAGFDQHQEDWGRLLTTEDYREIGRLTRSASRKNKAGCFALLEGGYNHDVLGRNVLALLEGIEEG
jgi:acetoin utilization deacetylase AcuC-like enzyme